ncbi:MAG: tRNA pseudouridine(55) synthase TruB [Oscillospiraceae bacterium]
MNGILLIDKPQGWTSHDVVAKLRGLLGQRRIGHSGTLDPMATGLLVVFLGRATRAVEFAEAQEKEYIAGLRLGLVTDTQDITGKVLERHVADVSPQELESVLDNFRGDLMQLPPMYSAVKIGGKRLYQLARKGHEVERKPRPVHISRLEIIGEIEGGYALRVRCSKGTYIRTLCHDIGQALGCGGAMSSLRRVAAGGFRCEDAYAIEDVEKAVASGTMQELILPVDRLFMNFPAVTVDYSAEQKCRCGAAFQTQQPDGEYRVYSKEGEFLMLGQARGGRMSTIKSFFEV